MNSKTLRVASRLSTREISEYLKLYHYTEDRGYGFKIIKSRNNVLEIKHIEKLETLKVSIDPLGNTVSSPFDYFIETIFKVDQTAKELTIFKPSRNLPHLLRHFNQSCEYKIGIELIYINLNKALTKLKEINHSHTIRRATFVGSSKNHSKIRLEITGDNLNEEINEQVKFIENPKITKLTLNYATTASSQVEFTEDYRVKFGTSISSDFREDILNCLRYSVID